MLRYALYARKSKDDKSGVIKSIKDQVDIWHSLAAERGLQVVEVLEENRSAKTPGLRPVYQELIRKVRSGAVDGILVWHVNRLARNMEEAGTLAQLLIDGAIKEIRTPNWTYKPGDNILPLLLEQGMSTQYSLDLSQAVKRGTDSMVADGGWPHQAKVGYLNARDPMNPKRGIVIRDPERFDLMRKGFDLMLTGSYSVRQVIDVMNNDWGFRTRPTPSRPDSPLSPAAAYNIFSNPFYAGYTVHNGVQHKGRHDPMVTAQEFNRLQEILRARRFARGKRNPFLYTGMIRCGYCGAGVTAEQHFKSGKHRIYYHCTDPKLRCTKRGITEEALETEIIRLLESVTVDEGLCQIALDNIARWQGQDSKDAEEILNGQHRALEEVERQRNNLLNMMVRGLLTDERIYKEKEAELLKTRSQTQLELQRVLGDLEHIRAQAWAGLNFVKLARDRFMLATGQKKKEIARALGIQYVLKGNDLRIELDPLLKEIVQFTDGIMGILEPGFRGSESQYRSSFSQVCRDGRGTQAHLELPQSLKNALRGPLFPDLFVQSDFQH